MTENKTQVDCRSFTDADIETLCDAITNRQKHQCRFADITPEQLRDAVIFHRHVIELVSETGSTIGKTILVIGVTGLVGLLILGISSKIKSALGV